MRRATWWALGGLVGLLGLVAVLSAPAQAPRDREKAKAKDRDADATLEKSVARAAREKEATVKAVLRALGPAVRAQLTAGKQVELPGIGVFRIAQVAQHKDLGDGGRPVVVPAANYVEFVPAGDLQAAASAPGAVPAKVVPPFEYHPRPGAAPGLRSEKIRTPGTRIR
jgi:nucleoid DNA-binding protein